MKTKTCHLIKGCDGESPDTQKKKKKNKRKKTPQFGFSSKCPEIIVGGQRQMEDLAMTTRNQVGNNEFGAITTFSSSVLFL